MQAHRFLAQVEGLTDLTPVVTAARPAPAPGAFMVCPFFGSGAGGLNGMMAHQIYRLAYEQAVALTRPPRHERWLLASSN
jgi:hypothetical protein